MNYSQGQLDAIARHRGFPDYATMMAWNAHRQAAVTQPQQPPQQQGNFLQTLLGKIPFHPAYLLNYVNGKINGAGQ